LLFEWIKQFGKSTKVPGNDTTNGEECFTVAVDANYVYCAGGTDGDLGEERAGGVDAFVMKFEKNNGKIVWIKQLGSETDVLTFQEDKSKHDYCVTIALDDDYVYCGGWTEGNLGEGRDESDVNSPDAFVMKLRKIDGKIIWIKQLGSATYVPNYNNINTSGSDGCSTIAVDDEHLFCAGSTSSNLGDENSGFNDAFVMKLDKESGEVKWVKQLGKNTDIPGYESEDRNATDSCQSIALDNEFVYCGGLTGGSLGEEYGEISGQYDAFIIKLSKENFGEIQWVKQLGPATLSTYFADADGSKNEWCTSIAVDDNSVYCAGITQGSLSENKIENDNFDPFIAKFSKDNVSKGQVQWIKQLSSETDIPHFEEDKTKDDECLGIAIDNDYVYCGGITKGSLREINGGIASPDLFMMKLYKNDGELLWVKQLGQTTNKINGTSLNSVGFDTCKGVAIDKNFIYCAGSTDGDLAEINGGGENYDAIILKLNLN